MALSDESERTPDPIDVYVGQRIRARRKALGMSQERLADALGLTFQQVQKYERGANRVSGSKLWYIAKALQTQVPAFYDGLQLEGAPGVQEGPSRFDHDLPEAAQITALLPSLEERHRRMLVELARSLAGEAAPGRRGVSRS